MKFTKSYNNLVEQAENEIQTKKLKRIGYTCSHIPEELLSFEGMYGYRLHTSNKMTSENADSYLSTSNCTYTRCIFETILGNGSEWMDGYVFSTSCDHLRRMYDNFMYAIKPSFCHLLKVPTKTHDSALQWYANELTMLRSSIGEHFNCEVDDDHLNIAIHLCNYNRSLLSHLNEFRTMKHPLLSGEQMQQIVNANVRYPKYITGPWLLKLLNEINTIDRLKNYRVRLMLIGSQNDDPEYIRIIEDQGALIVADAHCVGSMYYSIPFSNSNSVMDIAKRYLQTLPCPRILDSYHSRYERIYASVKKYHVDGIIIQTMKYCDFWGIEGTVLADSLRKDGFPYLHIEREYSLKNVGQFRTKIQAFVELLTIKKKKDDFH